MQGGPRGLRPCCLCAELLNRSSAPGQGPGLLPGGITAAAGCCGMQEQGLRCERGSWNARCFFLPMGRGRELHVLCCRVSRSRLAGAAGMLEHSPSAPKQPLTNTCTHRGEPKPTQPSPAQTGVCNLLHDGRRSCGLREPMGLRAAGPLLEPHRVRLSTRLSLPGKALAHGAGSGSAPGSRLAPAPSRSRPLPVLQPGWQRLCQHPDTSR